MTETGVGDEETVMSVTPSTTRRSDLSDVSNENVGSLGRIGSFIFYTFSGIFDFHTHTC